MIVALASPPPPHARLQAGIQSAVLAGIAEAEVSRCRDVLDCRRSREYMSIVAGILRAERFCHAHIYNGSASVHVNPWGITKVARVQKIRRDSQGHDVWTTGWSLEPLRAEVVVGIIGDQVILSSVCADGDRLLQNRSDPQLLNRNRYGSPSSPIRWA